MPEDPLDRITRLLVSVERLIAKIISEKHNWRATAEEWAFLSELSELLGQRLPPLAGTATTVALEFLLTATFSLQTTQRILRENQPADG